MSDIRLLNSRVVSAFFGDFKKLRDVQEACIKPLLQGLNVVVCAGTGSGKTEAVLAPLASRHWKEFHEEDSTIILYVAPTRALVNDVERRLHLRMERARLRMGIRHGDRDDLWGSKKKPHLVITTPESLDVLLFRDDPALRTVRAVVIDEVHMLYNSQRGLHLAILLERLTNVIKSDTLQVGALSATIGDLEGVADFFLLPREKTELLKFPPQRSISADVRIAASHSEIEELIGNGHKKLLGFVDTRKKCEEIATRLNESNAFPGPVFAHYSSLSKEKRLKTEAEFQKSRTALCIATSTLELGIDIGDVDAVLLYTTPTDLESFLQRIGRGNRRTNQVRAVCVIGQDEGNDEGGEPSAIEVMRFLVLIEAATKGELPKQAPFQLFGAVVQQCLSMIAQREGAFRRVEDLFAVLGKLPFVDRPLLERLLDELCSHGYLQRHKSRNQYGAEERLHELVHKKTIYGNLPATVPMIELRYRGMVLGEIPRFNTETNVTNGVNIAFSGRKWFVRKVAKDHIDLEPSRDGAPYGDIVYRGQGLRFDTFVTNRVWEMIHSDGFPSHLIVGGLRGVVIRARERARRLCSADQIPYKTLGDGICYYTFGGVLVNLALSLLIEEGVLSIESVWLTVAGKIDWKSVPTNPEDFESVFSKIVIPESSLSPFQKLLPPDLLIKEFFEEWVKDESIPTVLARLRSSTPVEVHDGEWLV